MTKSVCGYMLSPMPTTKRRRYYMPGAAAEEIGVSVMTLWRWRRDGKAATVRVKGTTQLVLTVEEVSRLKKMWENQNAGN